MPRLAPQLPLSRRYLAPFLLLLIILAIDQGSKFLARQWVPPSGAGFVEGLVRLSLVENHGGFLGIVADLPHAFRLFFLIGCVGLLLCACLLVLYRAAEQRSPYRFPLACIAGGGLSNLLDRLYGDGGVTDFLILGTGIVQTGIFNLADVFILAGSFVLGYQFFRGSKDRW